MSPRGQLNVSQGGLLPNFRIYLDTNTQYICDTTPGALVTEQKRRVRKIIYNNATYDIAINGTQGYDPTTGQTVGGEFNLIATDLATVAGYSYN